MISEHHTLRIGLLGAWCPSLGGDAGNLLRDRSGRGRNASLVNTGGQVVYRATPSGVAAQFDGVNDYAQTTISSGLSGTFTFSAWGLVTDTNSHGPFACSEVASYANYWAFLGIQYGSWVFALFNGSNNPGLFVAATASVWTHLVGTRNTATGQLQMWVNGVSQTPVTDTAASVPTYSSFTLGGQPTQPGRVIPGMIADVRVWSRALTAHEIRTLYQGGPGVGFRQFRNRRFGAGSQMRINVGGTWKSAQPWVKVGGVWKKATPYIRQGGVWK